MVALNRAVFAFSKSRGYKLGQMNSVLSRTTSGDDNGPDTAWHAVYQCIDVWLRKLSPFFTNPNFQLMKGFGDVWSRIDATSDGVPHVFDRIEIWRS